MIVANYTAGLKTSRTVWTTVNFVFADPPTGKKHKPTQRACYGIFFIDWRQSFSLAQTGRYNKMDSTGKPVRTRVRNSRK